MGVDDLNLRQLSAKLASIYGTPVDVQVLSGSAIVRVSAVLNATYLSSFATQASQIGDDVLSRMLGLPTAAAPFAVRAVNVSVPFDEPCTVMLSPTGDPHTLLPSTPRVPLIPIALPESSRRSRMLRPSWLLL